MSIVRYVNKETGRVTLYESTSYYDPETKQSRPKRKYLGVEDPETGELIPSSGRPGRRKKSDGAVPTPKKKKEDAIKAKYDKVLKESKEKDARIKQLEHENKRLKACLQKLRDTASEMLNKEEL